MKNFFSLISFFILTLFSFFPPSFTFSVEPQSFQTLKFEIKHDLPVPYHILFCADDEALMTLRNRKLYKTRDGGVTWIDVTDNLEGSKIEEGYDGRENHASARGSGVYAVVQLADPMKLVILGVFRIHWVTEDCGRSFRRMNTTADIRTIRCSRTPWTPTLSSSRKSRWAAMMEAPGHAHTIIISRSISGGE